MSEENTLPPQHQDQQPGQQSEMHPKPVSIADDYKSANKLTDRVALITGGDSGIGRAVALAFAAEGADIAIVHSEKDKADAAHTAEQIEQYERKCLLFEGDIGSAEVCKEAVQQTVSRFGRLDILVNNAGEQHPQESIADIDDEQLLRTFQTNIFAMFYFVRAALPHLKKGARIINTASVTTYHGSPHLLDYAATKGAIVGFTRSLSGQLVKKGIQVNAVAPGPIWTPLIPASFDADEVSKFGHDVPMARPGQPNEVAHAYVFLASEGADYMTGQVLHPNGGSIVNG